MAGRVLPAITDRLDDGSPEGVLRPQTGGGETGQIMC